MDIKKPQHVDDEIWKQHKTWMDVTGEECKANRLKQEQARKNEGRPIQS